jgi:flagellar motor switch protein FliM
MSGQQAKSEAGRDSLAELFAGSSNFVERMPMLRVIFERAGVACSEDIASLADPPPQLLLQDLQSGVAGELLAKYDGKSVFGVLHASRWSARLAACLDRPAVFAIVDMMLGSDGSQPPYDADRPFSRIEMRIAEAFLARLAKALEAGLAGVAETPLSVEAALDHVDFDAIGKANNPMVLARYRLESGPAAGEIVVAVARAALNPHRQALARVPTKEAPAVDPRWREQMQTEVTRAQVVLNAILDERPGTLGEVASFGVGKIVELNATASGRVRLECNGEPLLWCHLGKAQGKYTLRVDEPVDREQEFMNELLSG